MSQGADRYGVVEFLREQVLSVAIGTTALREERLFDYVHFMVEMDFAKFRVFV